MKCLVSILLACSLALPLSAQTERGEVLQTDSVASYAYGLPTMLPVCYAGVYGAHYMDLWDIHQGWNASVEMGVSVGFGKRNPWRGAHFFTGVTALYAYPVNDRLTLGLGADYCAFTGWGRGHNSVGLFGLANYRINDRLDVTGFVEHDFGQLSSVRALTSPLPPFLNGPSTTVGADLGIKVGGNTRINLGVSFTREQGGPFGMPETVKPQQPNLSGREDRR